MPHSDLPQAILDDHKRFVLRNFDQKPPFSSFLPGISGLNGIPMWVFYTNRGQAISSFGTESKDRPIMEFQPANKAYQLTDLLGFRTFICHEGMIIEPFTSLPQSSIQRDMLIGMNDLELREIDRERELETRIVYFNLPGEPLAGLARQVFLKNLSKEPLEIEVLDGLPVLCPFGVDNNQLKYIGRTIEAWMEVLNLETNLPFFRLRASAQDTSEIRSFQAGHYAVAATSSGLLPAIVDPRLIFGADSSFREVSGFTEGGLAGTLTQNQTTEGRTPCAFFGANLTLPPGGTRQINSIYGYTNSYQKAAQLKTTLMDPDFLTQKHQQARDLAVRLSSPIKTKSAHQLFDSYCSQTFLDNLLRGGWPLILPGDHIYHVFSRKHGDPERDYNHFFLAAEYYSQGNGSYRDVNQNRRSDVFFEPRVADFNIQLFLSLIQIDGYNPLVVKGTKFTLPEEHRGQILKLVKQPHKLAQGLTNLFTPGSLLELADASQLTITTQEFLEVVFGLAHQQIQAEFGEGYWVDHWTYSLDLIETYLSLYPDKKNHLLFGSRPLPFFDSPAVVNPRAKKYVLDGELPRQFNAVSEPEDKLDLIKGRQDRPNWVRTEHGKGEIFRLPLVSKLVLLAVIKFASRDPFGMGIEMEAGRPGWDDALNGLPGIFGSSVSESMELARLLEFLIGALQDQECRISLPIEVIDLLEEISAASTSADLITQWDKITTALEDYREKTRLGVNGLTQEHTGPDLLSRLTDMRASVLKGLDRAQEYHPGITPAYFRFEVTDYKTSDETDAENRPYIQPIAFKAHPLPLFLEGPMHQLKILSSKETSQSLYEQVRSSVLFDSKLKTYKLNASLSDEPFSIGRARAFSPGWLENESIWLHMTLKYLLEILKAGLYDQFFEDLQHTLPPFLDPEIYGRSPLENSSFIASSAHPDPALHGRGFIARLSGATAEFISIWLTMMTGGTPFTLDENGNLQFSLQPILPGWLFPESGILEFHFLGNILTRIHNPLKIDTWNINVAGYTLTDPENSWDLSGGEIMEPYAGSIREGRIQIIDVHYR